MARAGAKVQRWKRAKARMKRLGKIFLAYSMIAFALLLIWCCLLNPSFLPEVQAPVRYGELPLAQFMKLSSTNLNTATPLELMELPGIGEVLAGRIVTYRLQRGALPRWRSCGRSGASGKSAWKPCANTFM